MKKTILGSLLLFFIMLLFGKPLHAQSYLGGGFGTYHIPGAIDPFKGYIPSLTYEYITVNQRESLFADIFTFSKSQENINYTYYYSQLGFKHIYFGDSDEKKLLAWLGGGVALGYAKSNTQGSSDTRTLYGIHMTAGLQYNFQPLIVELKTDFDIVLQPLIENAGTSNILTNLRISFLFPITK